MKATPAKKLFGKPSAHTKARMKKWMMTGLIYAIVLSVETVNAMPLFGEAEELHCGYEEHKHTDTCYEKDEPCDILEHEHSDQCYSDPKADVESSPMDSVKVKLTGKYSTDLAAIAEEQVGYKESADNFKTGSNDERFGYTRYGAWYENPYQENWSAWFVSFCMEAAGIDFIQPKDRALLIQKQIDGLLDEKEAEPVEENEEIIEESADDNSNADLNTEEEEIVEDEEILETEEAVEEVVPEEEAAPEQEVETEADPVKEPETDSDEEKLFTDESDYVPHIGDLIFLNREGETDGVINHIGIVTKLHKNKQEEVERVTVVEGDVEGEVVSKEYDLTEDIGYIKGYGKIFEKDKTDEELKQEKEETDQEQIGEENPVEEEEEVRTLTYENGLMEVRAHLEAANDFPEEARLEVKKLDEELDAETYEKAMEILTAEKEDIAEEVTVNTEPETEAADETTEEAEQKKEKSAFELYDFSILNKKNEELEPKEGKVRFEVEFKNEAKADIDSITDIHHIVDMDTQEVETLTSEINKENGIAEFEASSLSVFAIEYRKKVLATTNETENSIDLEPISLSNASQASISWNDIVERMSNVAPFGIFSNKVTWSGHSDTNVVAKQFKGNGTATGTTDAYTKPTNFRITLNKKSDLSGKKYTFGLFDSQNNQIGTVKMKLEDKEGTVVLGGSVNSDGVMKFSSDIYEMAGCSAEFYIYIDDLFEGSNISIYELDDSGNAIKDRDKKYTINNDEYTVDFPADSAITGSSGEIADSATKYSYIQEFIDGSSSIKFNNMTDFLTVPKEYKIVPGQNGGDFKIVKDSTLVANIETKRSDKDFVKYIDSSDPVTVQNFKDPNFISDELKRMGTLSEEIANSTNSEDAYIFTFDINMPKRDDVKDDPEKRNSYKVAAKNDSSVELVHPQDKTWIIRDAQTEGTNVKKEYAILNVVIPDNVTDPKIETFQFHGESMQGNPNVTTYSTHVIINPVKWDKASSKYVPYNGELAFENSGGICLAPQANITLKSIYGGSIYSNELSGSHELHRGIIDKKENSMHMELSWDNKSESRTLPSTGGIGTTFFTIGGLFIIMLAGGALYLVNRSRFVR